MQRTFKWLLLLVGTGLVCLLLSFPASAQLQLTAESKLTIDGIGPIRVGMTVAEAEASAQVRLVERGARAGGGSCYYLRPQSGLEGLAFMVTSNREDERIVRNQDQIARVDVYQGGRTTTVSGAKIGDSEARIKAIYGSKIQVSPHKYSRDRGGKYLTYVPRDAADRSYRLIFETLNGRVTQFRSGRLPEVEYVEGCA